MKPPVKAATSAAATCKPIGGADDGRRLSPDRRGQGAAVSRGRPEVTSSNPDRVSSVTTSSVCDVCDADITVSPEARCFEVLIPPTLMKQLGLLPGCSFAQITTESESIVCEAGLSTALTKKTIGLCAITAATLVDTNATIQKASDVPLPLRRVVLKPVVGDLGLEASRRDALEVMSPIQLTSLFRRHCQGHVVFVGMVASLRIVTQEFRVEVVGLTCPDRKQKQSVYDHRCGLLVASTEVIASLRSGDGEGVTDEMDEPAPSSITRRFIIGDSGCGKSYRLQMERDALKRDLSITNCIEVDVASFLLKNARGGVTHATALRDLFREARAVAPSLIMIDDLHLLCPSNPPSSLGTPWGASHVAFALASELDDPGCVHVIVTAPTLEAVAPQLTAFHRLGGDVVTVAPPSSASERLEVLCNVFASGLSDSLYAALAVVAENAHGCTQRDLHRLKSMVVSEAFQRCGSTDKWTPGDVELAAKRLRPSALRNMEVAIPNVTWADIGGSLAAKSALQDCVDWCLGKNRWIFESFHLSPPRGVLLYGPPGCSKTMLAKALANESKMNFISIKGPEVFSKWVGDSEKAVREIFRKARAVAPCVVFVDELDGMCGHRGSGGVSDRVISQFLTELDGLPAAMSEKSDSIILVAATNRPENIDGAVLRPGRIDRKVYVGLPDVEERVAIALMHLSRMPTHPEVTAAYVAERTQHYTGAEVVAVCKEAAFHALERDFATDAVTLEDLEAALTKVKPRISAKEVEWYKKWASGQR
jgi:SpoVK/Ycf46/Vps4 family AAA+-type ATPase